ncbi:hypothetical protein Tco_1133466 [Tanacetum coccineum]
MAALRYRDEHNKVGYLQKPKGSDDYHQILDFLGASHIRYALTNDPVIFDSLVKQFWSTATLRSPELGPTAILATIDETPYTINEESVRSQLQLADDGGIYDLPIVEIYSGMDNLGTKSGSWDQFGSSIVVALICLSDGRRFNWSSYIFKGMVSNIGNAKKFLMYPRFLQTILGIETSITRQYHVFKLSSKLFANMKLNFVGQPMPLLDAMLSQAQEGEGAGADVQAVPPPIPETIPETRHESDHSQDHLSTPPRQQATPHVAPVFEHGQRTDPNIASSTRVHETEDDSLGGSFHVSPPRFTQASPTGHASGGAEDHITLSALSSVVSTLVKKVNSLETELKAHKKLFKDVVPKLVKKVKALEVKLKTKKRKVVLSDSDQEEGGEQAVDLDALIALANAAVTVDSTKSPGGASSNPAACSYDPTSDVPTTVVPTDVPSGVDPTGPSTVSPGSTTVPTSSSIPATVGINPLVHSFRALSTLRRSGLRTASAAAKPCQGDSLEFYLITGRIPDDLQHSFRNSDACDHDPEKYEHAGSKVTTIHGGNTTTRMIKRFTMADDLKESSKITQVQRIENKSKTVRGWEYEVRVSRVLEADVARCDWWIQLQTAGGYEFDNHQPQEIPEVTPFVESKEWIETNNELYKMMEDFTERMNQELRKQEALLVAQREQELREQEQAAQEKEELSPNFVFRQNY